LGSILGFAVALSAGPQGGAVDRIEMSAADVVSSRFPLAWTQTSANMPTRTVVASADPSLVLFDPTPTYPTTENAPELDSRQSQSGDEVGALAPAKLANATAIRPVHRSNAVLNEQQIASIKRRLNLTPEQERYWPAIEAELRKMEYKKSPQGSRTAAVDMSKVNMDGLKSAGVPLVTSFSDDQRRELKSLAHLLGVEDVF
jgi:hypothetical protein